MGAFAPDAAGPPRASGRDRLVAGVVPGLGGGAGSRGGGKTGPNPTDRGKQGSKRHLVVDRNGIPLVVEHSAANVHDSKMLEQTVDAIWPIHGTRGRPGRPRKRPEKLHAYTRATTSPAAARPCVSEGSQGAHRPTGCRFERAAGSVPVGGGASFVVAEPLPATQGALREARRYPPSVSRPRMCADLLALHTTVLLGVLNP